MRDKTHYLPSLKVKLGDEQFDKRPKQPAKESKRRRGKTSNERGKKEVQQEQPQKKVKFAEEESDLDEVNIYEELERDVDPYEPYKILAMKVKPR